MAGSGGIRAGTATEGINAITDEWADEIFTKPNEEGVIISKFMDPTGVRKIGKKLHVSIIPVIAANDLADTAQAQSIAGTLVYHTGTILEITATPIFSYAIVELTDPLISRLTEERGGQLKAKYRKQLLAALSTRQDVAAAALATGISTQLGVPSNFDQAGMLQAKGLLVQQAKEFVQFNIGQPNINLCYHPSQMQYIDAIAGITQAYARGDNANPTVKGVVHDAWGMTFAETGNILVAAGVAYNMLFTKEAFIAAYNTRPMIKPDQDFEYVLRIPAKMEFAVAELFDEAGVIWRSAA